MKNNDSISQHGLFCFTKGLGSGEEQLAGWCCCGGSLPMLPMLVATGWGMARTGPSWPADGAAVPRVPSLPVTRCNTPHISAAADTVTVTSTLLQHTISSTLQHTPPTLASFHPPPPSSQYLTVMSCFIEMDRGEGLRHDGRWEYLGLTGGQHWHWQSWSQVQFTSVSPSSQSRQVQAAMNSTLWYYLDISLMPGLPGREAQAVGTFHFWIFQF